MADEGLTTRRLEALSDGIFAFAMTLLVLDLKIAKIPEAASYVLTSCIDTHWTHSHG